MHLQLSDILIALLLGFIIYAWWYNTSVKEYALLQAKKHCQSLDLQLLDDSVAGIKWIPVWNHGNIGIKRIYTFEFSSSGSTRYQGQITYLGKTKQEIWLSPHDL